jgi:hypothetical protein
MARIFIDGEWDGWGGPLISMALVAEDGREWYEVVTDRAKEPWVRANVIPNLGKKPVGVDYARASMVEWLKQFSAIHIVADWPEDIEKFCQLLIVGPGTRVNTPPLTMEIIRIDTVSELPHNALFDARALAKELKA